MPVPKRKQSKQRSSTRFANWKVTTPSAGECPQCHETKLSHRVCRHCGYYDGVMRIDTTVKQNKE